MLRVFRDGSRYFLFSLNLSFKGLWEIVNFLLQLKVKNNIINDILHSIYIKVLLATVFRYSRQSVVHHGRGCLIAIDAIFLSTKDLFISCTLNLNYHNKIIITNINFRFIFRQLYVNVLLFLNLLLGRNLLIFFLSIASNSSRYLYRKNRAQYTVLHICCPVTSSINIAKKLNLEFLTVFLLCDTILSQ